VKLLYVIGGFILDRNFEIARFIPVTKIEAGENGRFMHLSLMPRRHGIVFTLVGSKSFEKAPIQPLRARRRLKDEL
jgi:hypothetical protein